MTNSEKIAEFKSEIARLQSRIEDLEKSEKKTDRWKPKYNDIYWFITSDGEVHWNNWTNDIVDENRYAIGNCFPTKESAEFEVERLKVLAEMKEFSFEPDWYANQSKYYLRYDSYLNIFDVKSVKSFECYIITDICFKTEEQAQACINSVGKDRIKKYYFRIRGND